MNRKNINDFAHAAIEDAKSEKVIGGHKIKIDKHYLAHWAHWHLDHHGHHGHHNHHVQHFHGHGHFFHGHGHFHGHC